MTAFKEFRSAGDFPVQHEERHHAVWSEGKIWLFGQTFLDQPTYNFGHYVSYAGGHSTYFDTATEQWHDEGTPRTFPPISAEENLDEVLFAFQTQIFMLLYVHFGGFRIASLHKFNESSGSWEKFSDVNTLPQNELPADQEKGFKQQLIRVDGDSPDGVYFVSFVDHRIRLHLLRLNASPSADWEIVAEVGEKSNPIGLQPTMAALIDGNVFIMGGVHGCGFRWQPLSLIKVDVSTGSSSYTELDHESPKPAFCFSGSDAQAILPASHQWIHFAGRNASGMTGSVFNGEVWALREITTQPIWIKLVQHIPDPKTNELHILLDTSKQEDGADGEMYVVSKYLGVLKAHFRAV